jgi:glycosyltransferase involved in cell wall biosynthesis
MTEPVLFVSYSGVLGGAERVLLDHVRRLERPLAVACPPGPLAQRLEQAGIRHEPVARRPLELGLAHAAGIAGLAREIRALKPSFVVAWGARAVLAAALEHTPWLAVHHDLLRQPTRAVVKAATRYASSVLSASAAIAEQFGGEVLHPGVDLDRFTPSPLPAAPPKALVLGALVAWKRPQLALAVAARLPELHVTVAGATLPGDDGRLEARLRAEAARLGARVRIAGPVEDVPAALAAHHALLHCADAEPYGLALVEALAAGRPVVAPDSAGPREIVRAGAGRLYAPGDPEMAAQALRAALDDPGAPAAARRRAEQAVDLRDSGARLERHLP